MNGNLGSLVIELGASLVTLQSDFARAQQMVQGQVAELNVKLNSIGTGANFGGISSQVKTLQDDFSMLRSVVSTVFAVDLGVGLVKQVTAIADEWQNATNRILTTVSGAEQLRAVQSQIFDIAQQTGQTVDDTAKMYQRLEQSIQSQGKTQAQAQTEAIALAKTLNEEIVVSGASAGEASRSIMDLVHGLSGGVLHAQQLRPIMRQMPDLAKQIADGLGVSMKKFEEMVHEGLKADDVLKALANRASVIDERFNALPKTFARAWQELSNAVEKYIGMQVQASSGASLLKDAISGVATHIEAIGNAVGITAAATAAWLGGKTAAMLGGMASNLKDMALAQGAYKTATVATAEAELALATSRQTAVASTLEQTVQETEFRQATVAKTQATIALLRSEEALLAKRLQSIPVGVDIIAESTRLEAVRAQLAVSTAALEKSEDALTAAFIRQEGVEASLNVETNALTAAQARLGLVQKESASIMGAVGRAGSGLFSAIGGWPAVILAAGAAWIYFAQQTSATQDAIQRLTQETEKAQSRGFTMLELLRSLATGENAHKQTLLEKTQAELDEAKATVKAYEETGKYSDAVALAQYQVQHLTPEIEKLVDAMHSAGAAEFAAMVREDMGAVVKLFQGATNAAVNWRQSLKESLEKGGDELDKEAAKLEAHVKSVGKTKAEVLELAKAEELAALNIKQGTEAYALATAELDKKYARVIAAAKADDAATAAQHHHAAAVKDTTKAYMDLDRAQDAALNMLDKIRGETQGPAQKALSDYNVAIRNLQDAMEKWAIAGGDVDEIIRQWQDGEELLAAQMDKANAKIADQTDVIGNLERAYAKQNELLGMSARDRKIEEEAIRAVTDAERALQAAQGAGAHLDEAQIARIHEMVRAEQDHADQIENNRKAAEDWANIWGQAGDSIVSTFSHILTEGGSLMDGLKSIAKQTVEAIIEYFAKLAIINPLLNSIFGLAAGGGSLLPTMANATGIFGGSGSGGGSILGQIGSLFTGGSGGGLGNIGSMLSNFWGGSVTGGGAAPVLNAGLGYGTGFGSEIGAVPNYYGGAPGVGAIGSPTYGGYGSALGQGLGIAGGLYAGYNRYQSGGGIAGGLAYGAGTYALGAGIASGVAGTGFAAGVSGAFGAVPVVGWIALAAMLIDHFSGGKLFGTKYQTKEATSTLIVGEDGGSATVSLYQEGQKSLFRGTKRRTIAGTATDEMIEAANKFYDDLKKTRDDVAKALDQTDIPNLIGGSFSTQNTYDKKGKVTGTKTFDEVLGVKYEEDANAFAQRLAAENMVALLDAGKAAGAATEIAAKWRSSAQELYDGAQFLVQAQVDINKGQTLLGVGADATLKATDAFVESMQAAGESLMQTYQRLEQASAAYRQTVAQIDDAIKQYLPQGTDFEKAVTQVQASTKAWTDQLNSAAEAAGLSAAKTEDLTKVQELNALQTAALVQQLAARLKQQEVALFGDPIQNKIDQDNAQADALQARIDQLMQIGAIQEAINLTKQQEALRKEAKDIGDKKAADDAALNRALQAQDFSKSIADYAMATGLSFKEIEAKFGFTEADLGKALGIDPGQVNDYLQGLETQAEMFVNFADLQKTTNDILNGILTQLGGTAIQPISHGKDSGGHMVPVPGMPAGSPSNPKGTPTTTTADQGGYPFPSPKGTPTSTGGRQIGLHTEGDGANNEVRDLLRIIATGVVRNADAQDRWAPDLVNMIAGLQRDSGLHRNGQPRVIPRATVAPR